MVEELTDSMRKALALLARRDGGADVSLSSIKIATSRALARRGLTQPHPNFPHIFVLSEKGARAIVESW